MVSPLDPTLYLTESECEKKAKECRAIAKRAVTDEHRIVLEQMADTWDRIRAEMRVLISDPDKWK